MAPAGTGLGQAAATPPPVTPAPTPLTLGLGATPPPVANALTQPSTVLGSAGKPAGFGGFGDASGAAQGSSSAVLGGLPKGISTGGGLGSVSAATPPPSMIWNGKMPGGSGDPSTNGQFSLQPGGGGRPAHALVPVAVSWLSFCLPCVISVCNGAYWDHARGSAPVHQWG